ncbi:NlpC/P60 family protein [Amycolatopsis magusensis]|uniref:NlpC/P60 family protein n=1 Tax=Amycolatopsis magusensis TaxID=882444 RepID=UPI001AEA82F9|nr:NlpC/P60 family protein [Amycolatopsis magusensis]MDI5976237.1 NlpC/P60 family protein [Amycolatopsis magusensis]
MQSHPVKRVVSGALAAAAVIAAVTLVQAPANATPILAPQQPPSSESEALKQYRELASQAEKLNEDHLNAQEDEKAKQAELDKANQDLEGAKQTESTASADIERYRVDVDKFAGASFTSGAQLNKMSALLTGNSAQDFLDRSSALDVLATDQNNVLQGYAGSLKQAADARQLATDAQGRAQAAKDEASRLKSDIEQRKKSLDEQMDKLEDAYGNLSTADKAAQKDTGADVGPITAPGAAAQTAVDAAMGKRGKPYSWGATGPNSFDCSGLTGWAYKQAGISIPRTSKAQSTFGKAVSRDQLQPGDLVFYNSPVSHVGIYIGGGNMVHAPTTGDVVKVAPLQKNYVGARRVA